MRPVHILLAILTAAFIVTLGVLSYQQRSPVEWMTEEQALALYAQQGGGNVEIR